MVAAVFALHALYMTLQGEICYVLYFCSYATGQTWTFYYCKFEDVLFYLALIGFMGRMYVFVGSFVFSIISIFSYVSSESPIYLQTNAGTYGIKAPGAL